MKGITLCAECSCYNMKTHKCNRGAANEPNREKGDDMRFFTDCPLPDVECVQYGRWILISDNPDKYNNNVYICSNCRATEKHNINVNVPYCWRCGSKMDLRTPTEAQLDEADSVIMGNISSD